MSDSVASRIGDEKFMKRLKSLIEKHGIESVKTLMSNSVACRIGDPTFDKHLGELISEYCIDKVTKLMENLDIIIFSCFFMITKYNEKYKKYGQ